LLIAKQQESRTSLTLTCGSAVPSTMPRATVEEQKEVLSARPFEHRGSRTYLYESRTISSTEALTTAQSVEPLAAEAPLQLLTVQADWFIPMGVCRRRYRFQCLVELDPTINRYQETHK